MAVPKDPNVQYDLRNPQSPLRKKLAEFRAAPGIGQAVTGLELTDAALAGADDRVAQLKRPAGPVTKALVGSGVLGADTGDRISEGQANIAKAYQRGGAVPAIARAGYENAAVAGNVVTDGLRRIYRSVKEEFAPRAPTDDGYDGYDAEKAYREMDDGTEQTTGSSSAAPEDPSQNYIRGVNASGAAGLRRIYRDTKGGYSEAPSEGATMREFDANYGGEFTGDPNQKLLTAQQEAARAQAARDIFNKNVNRDTPLMDQLTGRTAGGIDPLDLAKFQLDATDTVLDNNRADSAENRQQTAAEARATEAASREAGEILKLANDPENPNAAQVALGRALARADFTDQKGAQQFLDSPQGKAFQTIAEQRLQAFGANVGLFDSMFFNSGDSPNLTLGNLSIDKEGRVLLQEAGSNTFGDAPERVPLSNANLKEIFGTTNPDVVKAILKQYGDQPE